MRLFAFECHRRLTDFWPLSPGFIRLADVYALSLVGYTPSPSCVHSTRVQCVYIQRYLCVFFVTGTHEAAGQRATCMTTPPTKHRRPQIARTTLNTPSVYNFPSSHSTQRICVCCVSLPPQPHGRPNDMQQLVFRISFGAGLYLPPIPSLINPPTRTDGRTLATTHQPAAHLTAHTTHADNNKSLFFFRTCVICANTHISALRENC